MESAVAMKCTIALTYLSPVSSSFRSSKPVDSWNSSSQSRTKFSTLCRSGRRLPVTTSSRRTLSSSPVPPLSSDADSSSSTLPENIIVTETPEPRSQVRLTVEVPPELCKDCHNIVVKGFKQVAGLRPGKERILKSTIETILRRTMPHAMSSVSGRAIMDSARIVSEFGELQNTYSTFNKLMYEVIVDVVPEVKWVSEDAYKNLKIVVEIDKEINAESAAEQEFKRRFKAIGTMKVVPDRGLKVGDIAVVDISATKKEGEEAPQSIASADSKGFHFDTEDGDKVLPGFLDAIIGMQLGETRSFSLTFPDTWKQEHLRGVCAEFTVECKELFERALPELDDSVASKLLTGCNSISEVKELLLQRCLEIEQTARDQATDNAILDCLCKMVDVDVPPSLFEEQGRQFYGAKLLEIQANSKMSKEQIDSLSTPKAVNEFLEGQKDNIMMVIKQNLAVGDIFTREKLEVPAEELVKEIENSIAEFKRQKQSYNAGRVKEQVTEILQGAKVLEWLREHGEVSYTTR